MATMIHATATWLFDIVPLENATFSEVSGWLATMVHLELSRMMLGSCGTL